MSNADEILATIGLRTGNEREDETLPWVTVKAGPSADPKAAESAWLGALAVAFPELKPGQAIVFKPIEGGPIRIRRLSPAKGFEQRKAGWYAYAKCVVV